jgi:hypothetical protein
VLAEVAHVRIGDEATIRFAEVTQVAVRYETTILLAVMPHIGVADDATVGLAEVAQVGI